VNHPSPSRVASRWIKAAPAVDLDPRKVYYHGTPSEKAGKSILRSGIEPPDLSTRKGPLRPVGGKVYLTDKLSYGVIYALGGAVAGHEYPERHWQGSEWGYLFVVPGKALKEVQPDEDSVGEMISNSTGPGWLDDLAEEILTKKHPAEPEPIALSYSFDFDSDLNDKAKEQFFSDTGIDPSTFDYHDDRITLEGWFWDEGSSYNEDWFWEYEQGNLYDLVMDGDYAAWAEAGKILLGEMDSEQELELISLGAHIAHEGKITPTECWKIHKSKAPLLKKNGSNFFQVAERCR